MNWLLRNVLRTVVMEEVPFEERDCDCYLVNLKGRLEQSLLSFGTYKDNEFIIFCNVKVQFTNDGSSL